MEIIKKKYVEEVVTMVGNSFTEVTDEVVKLMAEGYKPITVTRHKYNEGLWIGGATKKTEIK